MTTPDAVGAASASEFSLSHVLEGHVRGMAQIDTNAAQWHTSKLYRGIYYTDGKILLVRLSEYPRPFAGRSSNYAVDAETVVISNMNKSCLFDLGVEDRWREFVQESIRDAQPVPLLVQGEHTHWLRPTAFVDNTKVKFAVHAVTQDAARPVDATFAAPEATFAAPHPVAFAPAAPAGAPPLPPTSTPMDVQDADTPRYGTTTIKPTRYNGIVYDSRLEARHAVFLEALALPFTPQPEACEVQLPNGRRYRIDFRIQMPDGRPVLLEVKPNYPTTEEIEKCEYLAEYLHRSGRPETVFLAYGEMGQPFHAGCSSKGVRLMHFYVQAFEHQGTEHCARVRDEGYVWTMGTGGISLRKHLCTGDTGWCHPVLLHAYDRAHMHAFA